MFWTRLYRALIWVPSRLMLLIVRTRMLDDDRARLDNLQGKIVCYALERPGLAELAVLERECVAAGLPPPSEALVQSGLEERRSVVFLREGGRPLFWRRHRPRRRLFRLVEAVSRGGVNDVEVVPVTVYWGRSADKERSLFKLAFAENWAIAGRLRKLAIILLHGRNVLVKVSPPVSVREVLSEGMDPERSARKLARLIRVHFRRLRVATIGPDLSHRRLLVDQVVSSRTVRRAVDREVEVNNVARGRAEHQARRYAREIAADYSYTTIRFLERILSWLWNRLYNGIDVQHLDNLKSVAEDHAVIYVPCHRSHMDYLLLSYVVYINGLVCPHIAAGINLNLPVVGPILRRGGAFFMRRSFRDKPLYAAVFRKYLSMLLSKGVAMEYFIEGGRSRTGRLLTAKPGMLAMTVRAFLRDPRRPVAFVPVYFGYERLIEGQSYVSELSGLPKKRESLLGLVRSLGVLRQDFGRVSVNFGTPIQLDELLDAHRPGWREMAFDTDERPGWVQPLVRELGERILEGINSAAAVTPVSLVSLVLLSTPRRAMGEVDLVRLLNVYLALVRSAPYSSLTSVTELDGRAIADYVEAMGFVTRQPHKLGDVLVLDDQTAVAATYFRNNLLHLYALPSLVACCFLDVPALAPDRIRSLCAMVYPYLRGELVIRWPEDELPAAVDRTVEVLRDAGLLRTGANGDVTRPAANTVEAFQLSVLGKGVLQALERFYIVIALLRKHGQGTLSQSKLEDLCHLMAQRMSMLYQLNAPEFFDRRLFRQFIARLKQNDVIALDDTGMLRYDDALDRADAGARLVLGERLRHDILQAVHV